MIDMHPDSTDVIVHSGPAERADVTGLPNLFGAGSRYRWRFIACGVAVTYRTDAAGLQLSGRVVSRPMPFGDPVTLVQLVDESGRVVASVRAVPDDTVLRRLARVAAMEGSRGLQRYLAPGGQVAQPEESYVWTDDLSRHICSPTGTGCWCAPAGLGHHVNEDGSRC